MSSIPASRCWRLQINAIFAAVKKRYESHAGRGHRSLGKIEFMLNRIVENEGEPDVVQISGGEDPRSSNSGG